MKNTRSDLKNKFRLIFIPFLLTAIGYLVVYTSLHWLLFLKLRLFAVKEDYLDFWTPFILPWIAAFTWLNRRIKLLQLQKGTRDGTTLLQFVVALAISIPIIVAQLYLETASGSMTRIGYVNDITKKPESKFYTISSFYIDTTNKGLAYTSDVSGRYNERLNLHIYISCPMYDVERQPTKINGRESSGKPTPAKDHPGILYLLDNKKTDSATLSQLPPDSIASVKVLKGDEARATFGNEGQDGIVMVWSKKAERNHYGALITSVLPTPKAWCCIQYSKQISNRKSKEEKKDEFHWFYKQSLLEFQHINLHSLSYLERTGYNDHLTGFKKAILETHLINDSSIRNILEPKFSNYADRNGHKLAWMFGSLAIGSVIWFALLLIYPIDDKKLKDFLAGKPQKDSNDNKAVIKMFVPRPGFCITPILVNLNILIFLIMVIAGLGIASFNSSDLLHWGANYRPKIAEGEWWRLLTSTFLHGGIYHLFANMAALLFVGMLLEPKLGTTRMAICYLVAGLLASLTSIWWNEAAVSVGASGAIFGLYGIFLTLMLTGVYSKVVNKIFLLWMFLFIGVNLLIGLNGGIDNAAHIGGLLTGMLLGLLIRPALLSKQHEEDDKLIAD